MNKANDMFLCLPNGRPSNFKLSEFANRQGVAIVHPLLVQEVQFLRDGLNDLNSPLKADTVWMIRITNATRTQADNERIARQYGWADKGGRVARNSRHLVKWGGIAVDLYAYRAKKGGRVMLPHKELNAFILEEELFDFVKLYRSHNHCDMRKRARK